MTTTSNQHPEARMSTLTPEEILALVIDGRGMCPFIERVDDASMCTCGLPALNHDEVVVQFARKYEGGFLATVERIVAEHVAVAKAEALREAAAETRYMPADPAKAAHWLRARADQIGDDA